MENVNVQIAQIAKLNVDSKVTNQQIVEKLNELIDRVNNSPAPRNRGPQSERSMSESDANRILLGDLKDVSHKVAAETLKLSYGQIYSARNGFTFKKIYQQANRK